MTQWTNAMAIRRWGATPAAALRDTARDGDFAKRHLINPTILRMLGPEVAADGPAGIDAYTRLPNFLVVAAERPN